MLFILAVPSMQRLAYSPRPAVQVQVFVVGPVPVGARRVLVESIEEVLDVVHLGGSLDAALGILTVTSSAGVGTGKSLGAEAAFAALLDDGPSDLFANVRLITLLSFEVAAECSRIAQHRRRRVRFNKQAAVFHDLFDQRFGLRVVGAEERSVLAVLLYPGGSLLKHELLGARHTDIADRIGGSLEDELEAEVLARFFHDVAPAAQQFVAHVAREGDVNERLGAHLLGRPNDEVATGDLIGADNLVGHRLDDIGVLLWFAGKQQNV